jgi:hypothetical protein
VIIRSARAKRFQGTMPRKIQANEPLHYSLIPGAKARPDLTNLYMPVRNIKNFFAV